MAKKSVAQIEKEIDHLYSRIREFERDVKPSSPKYKVGRKRLYKKLCELQNEVAKRMQEYFDAHRVLKPAEAKRFLKKHKTATSS